MAKGSRYVDKKDTRVLYKKSRSTIRTHSKTNSILAQTNARGSIEQLKQKLSREHHYYLHGAKIKRDLSIETDVCILRNSIRNKKNKNSHQDMLSQKSKFSAFTIGDSVVDNDKPGAGDSKVMLENTDIVTLIVDNFKTILNEWLHEYLLDSRDNIQKVEAIRRSLARKTKRRPNQTSRSSDIFCKCSRHKKQNRTKELLQDLFTPNSEHLCNCNSRHTVPLQCQKCNFVSTTRTLRPDMTAVTCNHMFQVKKLSHKNIFVSKKEPKQLHIDSSFVMLTMSSQWLTPGVLKERNKPSHVNVSVDSEIQKQPPCIESSKNNGLSNMEYHKQSLINCIYGDMSKGTDWSQEQINPCNEKNIMTENNSTDDNVKNCDHCFLVPSFHCGCDSNLCKIANENNNNRKTMPIECSTVKIVLPDCEKIPDPKPLKEHSRHFFLSRKLRRRKDAIDISTCTSCEQRDECCETCAPSVECQQPKNSNCKKSPTKTNPDCKKNISHSKIPTQSEEGCKQFNFLYRQPNKNSSNTFIGHLQSIFQYLDDCNKRVSVDIHVNVVPTGENSECKQESLQKSCMDNKDTKPIYRTEFVTLDTLMEYHESESVTTKESKSLENQPEIISVLDGAASKVNYLVVTENNSIISETMVENQNDTKSIYSSSSDKRNICSQINSLKNVIKGLTMTAEKLMVEYIREKKLTVSNITQFEVSPQNPTVDVVQDPQNETPKNINSPSYELWFTKDPAKYCADTDILEQLMDPEKLETYKVLKESSLAAMSDPPICNTTISMKDLKPLCFAEKEKYNNQSRGIQFSHINRRDQLCSGIKLQVVSKALEIPPPPPTPLPIRKPSFCFIESESVLKVTDMTSKANVPLEADRDINYPSHPLNFEVYNEKVEKKRSSLCHIEIVKQTPDHCDRSTTDHVSIYNFNIKRSKDSVNDSIKPYKLEQHSQKKDTASMATIESCNDEPKLYKEGCSRYTKSVGYTVLICTILIALVLAVYFTVLKPPQGRIEKKMESASVTESYSPMPILLSDFGF